VRILAVSINTFREAVRDRVLYVLLFFALGTILGSKAIGWITIGEDQKVVADISLAAVSVFGALIAIFVGTNLIYKDIDKCTIYTILSRPMWRCEFILGKYLGLAALLGVVTFIMFAVAALYFAVLGGTVTLTFVEATVLIYWQLLLVTAFSVLLSSLTSPILGAIIVFSCYVLGHATGILVDLPAHFDGSIWEGVCRGIYYLVPNLSNFDIRSEAANGVPVSAAYVIWTLVYGAIYTGMLLAFAAMAFENKDL
jgi:ABC-type transport system involved in multi-copper enzyme maturation permease subunit